MNPPIIKPDLDIYFIHLNALSVLLKAQYDEANTCEDMLSLMHNWFNEAERTSIQIKGAAFKSFAHRLYTELTGKSFESILDIN
ncbi:hypothetical protein N8009_02550 [Flavobacteriaceae bacterium]|nr:hypothetical protein [Flavobacteriaceae bacterium]